MLSLNDFFDEDDVLKCNDCSFSCVNITVHVRYLIDGLYANIPKRMQNFIGCIRQAIHTIDLLRDYF